jgi:tRNA 2-thiouridine synthesizing protein E
MADMMKYIVNGGENSKDPEGKMYDLLTWDKAIAEQLAAEEGIGLTENYWQVIQFLRDLYQKVGQAPNARVLLQSMQRQFKEQGGRRWLYALFPKGPISQGCKISGLPIPANSRDPSFGTSL